MISLLKLTGLSQHHLTSEYLEDSIPYPHLILKFKHNSQLLFLMEIFRLNKWDEYIVWLMCCRYLYCILLFCKGSEIRKFVKSGGVRVKNARKF